MLTKVLNPKLAIAAILTILVTMRVFLPFNVSVVTFYVLGVLMSGAFVFTWFPLAFRALVRDRQEVSLLRIVDYAGLQLIIFLAFLLILRNFAVYGIPPAPDDLAAFARVFLPLSLDLIIGLRLFTWIGHLHANRLVVEDPDLLVSSNDETASRDDGR